MRISWRKLVLIGVITLASLPVHAFPEVETTQHPIDAWYEDKLADENVSSTVDMRNITYQAQLKWDAELNVVYKRLMKRLSSSQKALLRKSQQQWLKYRDAEGEVILHIVSSQQGTIHQLSGTNRGMRLVRARALELLSYEQEFEK